MWRIRFVKYKKYFNQDGNVTLLMCFVLVTLLGATSLVLDIGMVYYERIELQNGIDAAALASVVELPNDSMMAYQKANEYLVANNIDLNDVDINIALDKKSITIEATKEVEHVFAKIIGINSSTVNAKNKAIIGPASSAKGGIRPFAVEQFPYTYGQLATLKEGGGDGTNGNYGVVALGGTGSNVAKHNILYGYDGVLRIGDIIVTEPGNMTTLLNSVKQTISSDPSCFDTVERDSERVWTIPVVSYINTNGRADVEIVGFAQFYIEDIGKVSGKVEVKGRFMEFVTNGDIDETATDYGVYAAKLSAY